MSDVRTILERGVGGATAPPDGFERMLRRRDRKRRNQRIAAGIVGIAVFVAAVWIVRDVASLSRTEKSVVPAVSGTTGPAETKPRKTGPSLPFLEADYLLDLKTGGTTPIPGRIRGDWHNGYAVSPDGSEVAFYGPGEDDGTAHDRDHPNPLFVARIDGTQVRQIADDAVVGGGGGSSDMGPGWSPDGKKIAYVGQPSGDTSSNVFVLDLASGVKTQVTFETVDVSGTEFSPDGSSVVYTALLREGSEVRIAPATGGEGTTLVGGHGTSASGASFSPDGSLLSYTCSDPGFDTPAAPSGTRRELCLANADGTDPRVIVEPESYDGVVGVPTASWSPDGSRLAYWTFYGVEGVFILDLATGQTTCVAGCQQRGATPPQAWPAWLDDHTLFVEAYHGPH